MKALYLALLTILIVGCTKQSPEQMKAALAGYWQAEMVVLPDGSKRDLPPALNVDYFEVTGDSGVRKKVSPKFDGTFEVNKAAERFYLSLEKDQLLITYKSPYDTRQEMIQEVKDSSLVIENQEGLVYHYRKFRSFELNPE